MQLLIIHEDGDLYTNTSRFAFIDPTTNIRFEAGLHVKTKQTPWMAGQPTIVKVEAEAGPEAPVDVPVAPTKSAKAGK